MGSAGLGPLSSRLPPPAVTATATLRSTPFQNAADRHGYDSPRQAHSGFRADAQAAAAKRDQAAEISQSLLPGVDFGLVAQQFLGTWLVVRQGNIFVAARALQHPTAPPAAPPADDGRIFGAERLRCRCGYSGVRVVGMAAVGHAWAHWNPQPARVAEFPVIHRVRLERRVGDDRDQFLPRAKLGSDQTACATRCVPVHRPPPRACVRCPPGPPGYSADGLSTCGRFAGNG